MSGQSALRAAKDRKNDEFYTRMVDVENELNHYWEHFKGRVIYCPCDNPEWSNFWLYFKTHFEEIGLEKLISTHYVCGGQSYKTEFDGVNEVRTDLEGDGDFRSLECREILWDVDIVVTNPPFSLIRDLVDILMEYNIKFLFLGTIQAAKYSNIFPYVRAGIIRPGFHFNKPMWFYVPEGTKYKKVDETGKPIVSVGTICWYTNMKVTKDIDPLVLTETYSPEKYRKYDNMDFINVDKVSEIPCDYYDFMGVPVTYLAKHDPTKFYLWDITNHAILDGKELFTRVIIRKLRDDEKVKLIF